MSETNYDSAIAVIGMSGRFPGAVSVDELWHNLTNGHHGLRPITEAELAASGVNPALMANPAYVRFGAPLTGVDQFDAGMFGFSRREADSMDPQHRLFLECAWEAIEVAGYPPNRVPAKVGVFAGSGFPDYLSQVGPTLAGEPGGHLLLAIGNERDSLSSMVSYKFDLRGPSIVVQTFCSTSLVAAHLAVQSLLSYECDIALAGGAHIQLPQPAGYLYEEGGITTPDGHIRSFDAAANGTVLGNGVSVVALKRMTEAISDGDPIHAVILGSAVNNDGRACAGYTAPGVDGQSEVVSLALAVADVKPATIGYVECHATGTMLGDSIELAALGRAFGDEAVDQPCVLGSLKPTIGHLDRASGVAGLIRASLALRHRVLPGTPNYQSPNPTLAAMRGRFTVLDQQQPWPEPPHPRRAGVSSFGFGGTNAHVVLEEAPTPPPATPRPGPHLLLLSARGLDALHAAAERLRSHLDQQQDLDLSDVAYTLQQSRTTFALRLAVVCADSADAVRALADPGRWRVEETQRDNAPVRLRIPDPTAVPGTWWPELLAAAGRLAVAAPRVRAGERGVPAGDSVDPIHERAARAVAAAFGRLGVCLDSVFGDHAAARAAERIAAEHGLWRPDPAADPVECELTPAADWSADQWLLAELARLWQAGVVVDWSALHPGAPRRVPLPTYPFQRQRYWIDAVPDQAAPAVPETGKVTDLACWTHVPGWRRQSVRTTDLANRLRAAGPWLVLADDARGDAFGQVLSDVGADATVVRPGHGFDRLASGDFTVRPDSAADYADLLRELVIDPRTVVHGFSLAPTPEPAGTSGAAARFDAAQHLGYHSVIALVRALTDRGTSVPGGLLILTSGAVDVLGTDLLHPEHAGLHGLAPVLAQENPGLLCRVVDIDPSGPVDSELATAIVTTAVGEYSGPVALRGSRRWVRTYEPHPLADPETDLGSIAAGSTVLITGGLGHVGFALAKHLSATRGCRLVLTTRSALPDRDLLTGDKDSKALGYLRRVVELEAAGAEVLAMSADVADADQMTAVVRAARARFGSIDVVVHAAGVQHGAFFGLASTMDRSATAAHFAAKVHGFLVLQQVLPPRADQLRITLSSLSTVLGGILFGPYAAANAALDAYAVAARERGDGRWVSVDWDAWQITAPADATGTSSVSAFEMTMPEGLALFERIVAAAPEVGHLVVSTGSLEARIAQWVTRAPADPEDPAGDSPSPRKRDPRPATRTPYVEPADGIEATLAEIWGDVLGIDPIGADDDFYWLGGDSILAIDLIARIRRELRLTVPVTMLLEESTVRLLAERLKVMQDGDA